jgi:hypothetical protein
MAAESRAKPEVVPQATRKRLEAMHQYDIELYRWAKDRFAAQIATLNPHFSNGVRRFGFCNRLFQKAADNAPQEAYSSVLKLFRSRGLKN